MIFLWVTVAIVVAVGTIVAPVLIFDHIRKADAEIISALKEIKSAVKLMANPPRR